MALRPAPLALALTALLLAAPGGLTPLHAQEAPPTPRVAASGRVVTHVTFDGRLIGTRWFVQSTSHSGPARLAVDYGQPHARGRTIFGELVPYGEVWRLGANMATHLVTDVNLYLGELEIPRGTYTLYMIPRPEGGELIVNRQTGQWGTDYDPSKDWGRVPLRRRALPETAENFTITLAPVFPQPQGEHPSGALTISWGEAEYSTDWRVSWP